MEDKVKFLVDERKRKRHQTQSPQTIQTTQELKEQRKKEKIIQQRSKRKVDAQYVPQDEQLLSSFQEGIKLGRQNLPKQKLSKDYSQPSLPKIPSSQSLLKSGGVGGIDSNQTSMIKSSIQGGYMTKSGSKSSFQSVPQQNLYQLQNQQNMPSQKQLKQMLQQIPYKSNTTATSPNNKFTPNVSIQEEKAIVNLLNRIDDDGLQISSFANIPSQALGGNKGFIKEGSRYREIQKLRSKVANMTKELDELKDLNKQLIQFKVENQTDDNQTEINFNNIDERRFHLMKSRLIQLQRENETLQRTCKAQRALTYECERIINFIDEAVRLASRNQGPSLDLEEQAKKQTEKLFQEWSKNNRKKFRRESVSARASSQSKRASVGISQDEVNESRDSDMPSPIKIAQYSNENQNYQYDPIEELDNIRNIFKEGRMRQRIMALKSQFDDVIRNERKSFASYINTRQANYHVRQQDLDESSTMNKFIGRDAQITTRPKESKSHHLPKFPHFSLDRKRLFETEQNLSNLLKSLFQIHESYFTNNEPLNSGQLVQMCSQLRKSIESIIILGIVPVDTDSNQEYQIGGTYDPSNAKAWVKFVRDNLFKTQLFNKYQEKDQFIQSEHSILTNKVMMASVEIAKPLKQGVMLDFMKYIKQNEMRYETEIQLLHKENLMLNTLLLELQSHIQRYQNFCESKFKYFDHSFQKKVHAPYQALVEAYQVVQYNKQDKTTLQQFYDTFKQMHNKYISFGIQQFLDIEGPQIKLNEKFKEVKRKVRENRRRFDENHNSWEKLTSNNSGEQQLIQLAIRQSPQKEKKKRSQRQILEEPKDEDVVKYEDFLTENFEAEGYYTPNDFNI